MRDKIILSMMSIILAILLITCASFGYLNFPKEDIRLKGNPNVVDVYANDTWHYTLKFPDSTEVIIESPRALGYQVGDTLTFLTRYKYNEQD